MLPIKYEHWTEDARCATVEDPDIFFPPRDKDLYKKIAEEAKAHCLGVNGSPPCPVRAECLTAAIREDEQHGIWGGMSHRERNALVRKWSRNFKNKMTLEEYIFNVTNKGETNGSSNKALGGLKEVPRR